MPQKSIELILLRQLSSYLSMPMFIVDDAGSLIYYNEAAEKIIGMPFSQIGEMPLDQWTTSFVPSTKEGKPMPDDQNPLVISLSKHKPANKKFYIQSLDEKKKFIEVFTVPLIVDEDRLMGVVAFFWEIEK